MLLKVRSIAKQVVCEMGLTPDNIDCQCAKVSARLHQEIERQTGKIADLCVYIGGGFWGHCNCSFQHKSKRYVVDLTYPQFDIRAPLILIEPYTKYVKRLKHPYTHNCCVRGESLVISTTNDRVHFRRYLLRGWPSDQKPNIYCKVKS